MKIEKSIIILVVAMLFYSSCSYRNYMYLKPKQTETKDTELYYKKKSIKYKIQYYDVLQITFSSFNEEISKLFNKKSGSIGSNTQDRNYQNSTYLMGYIVNDSGYVKLPIIGNVLAKGKTIDELNLEIQNYANEYLEDVTVDVRLLNYKITFFGEVGAPGAITFYQEEVNLMEAIIQAGGVTTYGDKKNIMIVRRVDDGYKTFRVDLTDRDILSSEDFFLLPNDLVYVEPLKNKIIRMDTTELFFYISTITSLVTTTILILSYAKN